MAAGSGAPERQAIFYPAFFASWYTPPLRIKAEGETALRFWLGLVALVLLVLVLAVGILLILGILLLLILGILLLVLGIVVTILHDYHLTLTSMPPP